MKIPRKRLELRPIRPGFLDIIPRLPAMVSKNEVLFKILSPITYVYRSIKNIFKKRPALQKIQQARKSQTNIMKKAPKTYDEDLDMIGEEEDLTVYNCGDFLNIRDNNENSILKSGINESQVREKPRARQQEVCKSCVEDRPAFHTCTLCFSLNSSLPPSSCTKCQEKGPIVKLCMKYHNKQPLMYLREEDKNVHWGDIFNQRRILLRQATNKCNGKRPAINNCPMCSSLWPVAGECDCRDCKKAQPIVKFLPSKSRNNGKIYLCPCSKCAYLRPKIKVCDACRSQKCSKRKKNTSFYVMLP